jgi:hypothetical protein
MNTFIMAISSLDCDISQPLNKSIMSLPSITLGNLDILGISALI